MILILPLPTINEIIKFLNTKCSQIEDASLHYVQSSNRPILNHPPLN